MKKPRARSESPVQQEGTGDEIAPRGDGRISAKLVYLLASTMVCAGLSIWAIAVLRGNDTPEAPVHTFDTETPLGTAEAFLDAWRRRDHLRAAELSTGLALESVAMRAAEDQRASDAEKIAKGRVWDQLAANPLRLRLDGQAEVEGGGLVLEGVAEGEFMDAPYRRAIRFMMVEEGGDWLVHEMELRQVLTSAPEPGPAAGELEPRGESVP